MESVDRSRAVAERYAAAWLDDDLAGILDCYANEFTLHYFGDNPHTGDHVGRDAALATMLAVGAKAPRRLLSVDEILSGPGAAVIVVRETIEVDGVPHEIRRVLRYRVVGSRFAECWLYDEQQTLVDRAWT